MLNCAGVVQQLSGARRLSSWRLDDKSALRESFGFLSVVTVEWIGRKRFVRLGRDDNDGPEPCANRFCPVSTLTIAAPDRFVFEELVCSINRAVKVLAQLLESPDVVAGAGCAEIHLAEWLRLQETRLQTADRADPTVVKTLRQLRQCVRAFADCVENAAAILCHKVPESALVEQLQRQNRPSHGWGVPNTSNDRTLFGWDSERDDVTQVLTYKWVEHEKIVTQAAVLDSLQCKQEALIYAVECALVIMRIGSVVKVH